jgi:hypothetical protein
MRRHGVETLGKQKEIFFGTYTQKYVSVLTRTRTCGLSRQLKPIGRYVERHREHLGLEKIQDAATVASAPADGFLKKQKETSR